MTEWVLLRGLGREAEHWGDFYGVLGQTLGQPKIHTPDIPGSGPYYKQTTPNSLDEIVDFLRSRLPSSERRIILGVSLGGMIALHWMSRFPDEVGGVIIINSSVGGLSPPWKRLTPSAMGTLVRIALTNDSTEREKLVLGMVSNSEDVRSKYLDKFSTIARERPISLPSAINQIMAARQFRLQASELKAPGLVLVCEKDRLASPSCSNALAKATGWPMKEHTWAGHDLCLDDPKWVAEQATDWFKSLN